MTREPEAQERFASALLSIWDIEGGECAHGVGLDGTCVGAECEQCHGSGEVWSNDGPRYAGGRDPQNDVSHPCPRCDGEGHLECDWQALRPVLREARDYIGLRLRQRARNAREVSDATG